MQLYNHQNFSVLIFRTHSIGSIGMRTCELGLSAIFSNAEILRCLYSCMPSSPKEYICPCCYYEMMHIA